MTQGANIPKYAFTTRERVKDRLGITDNAQDVVIDRYIKSITDYIMNKTNRDLWFQKYTNETYSVYGPNTDYLLLLQCPMFFLKLVNVTTVAGSPTVAGLTNTNGVAAGMKVVGDGVPSGTVVVSCDSTSITFNQNLTASSSSAYIQIVGLTSFQYRSGLPSTPNWVDFIPDQYEVLEEGESAIIRVYGIMAMSRFINNSVRVSYWAGYMIDWENVTDPTKHTLPGDLTMMAEDLVCRQFTRRKNAGKTSEGIQGSTVSWDKELDPIDQELLLYYSKSPRFY